MFTTNVKQVIPVPKRDYYLFVGDTPIKDLAIGSCVTDGDADYEILTIPHFRYNSSEPSSPTDFVLKPGEYDPYELVGKELFKKAD